MLERLLVEMDYIVMKCGEYMSFHAEMIDSFCTAVLYMFPFILAVMFLYTVVGWALEELHDSESLLHLTMLLLGVLGACVLECLKRVVCHMNPVRFYRICRGKSKRSCRKRKKRESKDK